MKDFRYAITVVFGIVVLFSGCAYQMPLRDDYVTTNATSFQANSFKGKRIILVMDSYLKNYSLTKPVYNWAGGNLAPDQVTFEIGPALSNEISDMCKAIFGSVKEVSNLRRAKLEADESIHLIIFPEISNAEIFFPSVRFADIKAEIVVKYSFYDFSGNFIDQQVVSGKGTKQLTFTRKNYQLAMESALKDLILKTNTAILEAFKDWDQPQSQFQTSLKPVNSFRDKGISASEYNNRGLEYYKNGQYNPAIEEFTTALSMEKNSSYYFNRGCSFYRLKRYGNAVSDFKQAINLAPNDAGLYAWCGNAYYAEKSYSEASEYFSKAIKITPDDAVLYLNRGYAQFKIGNRSAAASDFKRACNLGNKDGCTELRALEKE